MPVKSSLPETGKKSIQQLIEHYKADPGALLDILREEQKIRGYLSDEAIAQIAEGLYIPASRIYGVATFYSLLATAPRGRHIIQVCESPPCYINGAVNILKTLQELLEISPGETTKDQKFTLELTSCLGLCGVAPAMTIDGQVFGNLTPERVAEIIKNYS